MLWNRLKGRNDFFGIGDSMVLERVNEVELAVVILSNLSPDEKLPATVMGIKLLKELTSPEH